MQQLSLFGDDVNLNIAPRPYHKELQDLYDYAKEQSYRWWNRKFDIQIVLTSADWRRQNGCYIHYTDNSRPPFIKMSAVKNARRSKEEVYKTLLHELVHWHMHTSGLPCKDTDEDFVRECIRVGAPISGTKIAREALRKTMNI
ncbi:hypothetical protein AAGS61_02890 [Lysinibacillus sp. KU-BSD001]|uniref:hypothetical protein n=1 Tax=Lysinibacillus sp. KU-BSD001 TaxID=3141328 RepID=UPI0036E21190